VRGEVRDQRSTIRVARGHVAQRVDLEHHAACNAERVQDLCAASDDLGIRQRFGGAQDLHADLVELPVATLLRPLVAEHRAGIEHLARQVGLREAVGDQRATNPCGVLRPQSDAVAAAILEGVHLLRHDIGGIAERAGENAGVLEDRRRPFLGAVERGDPAGGVDDVRVAALIVADQVTGAANGL